MRFISRMKASLSELTRMVSKWWTWLTMAATLPTWGRRKYWLTRFFSDLALPM